MTITKTNLIYKVIVALLVGSSLFYLFATDINFKKPLPILHQQKDTTYLDSINYIIDIYALEKKEFDLRQHEKIYEWQHKSTIVIFIAVILVVITGLYLSYKQFEFTNRITLLQAKYHLSNSKTNDKPAVTQSDAQNEQSTKSTFEISKTGIKMTSAVIGLVILAMSIAFFILYLKFVYPINLPK